MASSGGTRRLDNEAGQTREGARLVRDGVHEDVDAAESRIRQRGDLLAPREIHAALPSGAALYAEGQPVGAGAVLGQEIFRDPAGEQLRTQVAGAARALPRGAQRGEERDRDD